jgi:DNA-binding protein HU-beta
MNKKELIAAIAEKAGLAKKDAEKALNAFVETVSGALKEGKKIQLVGFGTFGTKERAAREAKNPRTGETVSVPAATIPGFKAGKALKDIFGK